LYFPFELKLQLPKCIYSAKVIPDEVFVFNVPTVTDVVQIKTEAE